MIFIVTLATVDCWCSVSLFPAWPPVTQAAVIDRKAAPVKRVIVRHHLIVKNYSE